MIFANRNGHAKAALAEIELPVKIMQARRNRYGNRRRKRTFDFETADEGFASALLTIFSFSEY